MSLCSAWSSIHNVILIPLMLGPFNTFWQTSLIPNLIVYLLRHICTLNCCIIWCAGNPQSSRTFFGQRDSDARKTTTDEPQTWITTTKIFLTKNNKATKLKVGLGSKSNPEHVGQQSGPGILKMNWTEIWSLVDITDVLSAFSLVQ